MNKKKHDVKMSRIFRGLKQRCILIVAKFSFRGLKHQCTVMKVQTSKKYVGFFFFLTNWYELLTCGSITKISPQDSCSADNNEQQQPGLSKPDMFFHLECQNIYSNNTEL